MLNRRRFIVASGVSGAALRLSTAVQAQPDKSPVRVLIGFPPGGATDAIGRVITDRLPAILGQAVMVENKLGAGGRLAADAVLAAPADGLTYMIAPNATPTFQMLVFGPQVKWNILRDFTAVAGIASYPLGMGVSLSTGASNAREFAEWCRRNPDKAFFGTPGLGGQNHFLGVQLSKVLGTELRVAPYKGTPPLVTDLLGGHLASAIGLLDGMMAHHAAGKIKVIGVFSEKRSPLMPVVPTFAEQGFDITSGEAWTGLWTRAGAPAAQVERMRLAVYQVLQQPEVKEALSQKLWVQPHFRSGAELDAVQRAELAHWEPIIKASGFKPE